MGLMDTILNGDNLRTILVIVWVSFLFFKLESKFGRRIDGLESHMNRRIDGLEAHMNRRFDAVDRRFDSVKELAFILNKNDMITDKDKRHVDSYIKEGAVSQT